jgi:hypothetical protein
MITISSFDQFPKSLEDTVFFIDASKIAISDFQTFLKKRFLIQKISCFTISQTLGPREKRKLIGSIKRKMGNPFNLKSCVIVNLQASQNISFDNYDFQRPLFVFINLAPSSSERSFNLCSTASDGPKFSDVLKKYWKPILVWLACATALLLGTYGISWKLSLNEKDTIYNQMRAESVDSPYSSTYVEYSSPKLEEASAKKDFISSSASFYNTISKNGNSLVNTVLTMDARQQQVSTINLSLESSDLSLSPSIITAPSVGYISSSTNPENRLYDYFDAVSLKRKFQVAQDWAANNNNVCFISMSIADKLLAKLNEGQATAKVYEDLLFRYESRSSNDVRLNIDGSSYIIANIIEKGSSASDYYDFFESVLGPDFLLLSTSTSFYQKNSNLLNITATLPISYYTLKDYLDKNILSRWSYGDKISYFSTESRVDNDITSYTWVQKQELNDLGSAYDRLSSKTDLVDSYCYFGFFLACFSYFLITFFLMKMPLLGFAQTNNNAFEKTIYISIFVLIPLGISNGLMQLSRISNTDFSNRLIFSGTGSALGLLMWALPLIFFGSYLILFKHVTLNRLYRRSIQGITFNEYQI